jgi:hypothetical protein
MSALEKRVRRLEGSNETSAMGIAERLEAARRRWKQDPEGAEREREQSQRRLIKEVEDAHRAGRRVDTLKERLYHAYRRVEGVKHVRVKERVSEKSRTRLR